MTVTVASRYDHASFPGSPVQQAQARESALSAGLERLAAKFGVTFERPLHINSRGEIHLFLFRGQVYGAEFAALLCKHSPRTGIAPTKYMLPENNWCMMAHFDVARMLDEAVV